jgi:SPP1 family predicted phage head-tail adaptor
MFAGDLAKRVVFERQTLVDDGGGGSVVTWTTLTTVWAQLITGARGRERLEAGRLEAANMLVLRIRHSSVTSGITELDRVKIGGVPYQIRAIDNVDFRNEMIEMTIERGVAS